MEKQFEKHIGGFTFSNKRQRYEKSNVYFDPFKEVAYSYNHWKFVARIGGKMIFNTYQYSRTTSGHQSAVLYLMKALGYGDSIVCVESPEGLTYPSSVIDHYAKEIRLLEETIGSPRTRAAKNVQRKMAIEALTKHMSNFKYLLDKQRLDECMEELLLNPDTI